MKYLWGGGFVFMGFAFWSSSTGFALFLLGFGGWLIYLGRKQKQEIMQLSLESRKNIVQSQA
jgi:hypothetical protein